MLCKIYHCSAGKPPYFGRATSTQMPHPEIIVRLPIPRYAKAYRAARNNLRRFPTGRTRRFARCIFGVRYDRRRVFPPGSSSAAASGERRDRDPAAREYSGWTGLRANFSGNSARPGRAAWLGLLLPIPLAPGFRKARPVRLRFECRSFLAAVRQGVVDFRHIPLVLTPCSYAALPAASVISVRLFFFR
jgi:hypothetical protein